MNDTQNTDKAIIKAKHYYPTLKLDVSLYQDVMDDPSVSDDKKHKLLETLWAIAVASVDMGLGLHPLQQACGQIDLYDEIPNMLSPDMVKCKHTAKLEFDAVNPAGNTDSNSGKKRKEGKNDDTETNTNI